MGTERDELSFLTSYPKQCSEFRDELIGYDELSG